MKDPATVKKQFLFTPDPVAPSIRDELNEVIYKRYADSSVAITFKDGKAAHIFGDYARSVWHALEMAAGIKQREAKP